MALKDKDENKSLSIMEADRVAAFLKASLKTVNGLYQVSLLI